MWSFRKKTPSLTQIYKRYRKQSSRLADVILKSPCMTEETFTKAAKLLGVLQGKTLTLDSEEEMSAVMDFLLHDYRVEGKNLVERYQAEIGFTNPEDEAIAQAWLSSSTSLFQVTDVIPADNLVILSDRLHGQDGIELMDLSFSQTTYPGLLLFARLVPLPELNMTSGNTFVFAPEREKHILTKYKTLAKKITVDDERIKRFICFFKLNRTYGMEVNYR